MNRDKARASGRPTIKQTPATPLPFEVVGDEFQLGLSNSDHGLAVWRTDIFGESLDRLQRMRKDYGYLSHAANAYPRLIAAVREAIQCCHCSAAERDWGHVSGCRARNWITLLNEIGEW